MFAKILIANRGEIACRIIRTARRMGIATVAVYSDADADALHVEMADEAVAIGPAPAAASYLNIDRIVEACRGTGAEAVHPGYGFLAEQPAFAEALAAAGVAFIGPHAGAIAAMGDKIESKKLAADTGVPTIPGYIGMVDNAAEAVAAAEEIGLPVMIKASAGGGGRGMRIAFTEAEVGEGFRAARAEARTAFGDGRVYVERAVENPRHIEIQVLGDKHGNVIHLGERECSIQRRHQKIVEEAPSPAIDEALRRDMGAEAVALARAVGYDSAGTVEFVMDAGRHFFFLEMNARLQVEHPVTEMVTGIDLVEQMIRVAAGEPIGFGQDDVRFDGWAIEARVYAEDPSRDFLPSSGRLDAYRPPREGPYGQATVRVDSGVAEGSEVSAHYDPLIAKVIAHGPDRATASDALAAALDDFVIGGVTDNRGFLSTLIATPQWRAGRLSTGFIDAAFPGGFAAARPGHETLRQLAAVALAIEITTHARLDRLPGRLNDEVDAWRHWVVAIDEERFELAAERRADGGLAVKPPRGKRGLVASDWRPGEPIWTGEVSGETLIVQVQRADDGLRLSCRGFAVTARVMAPHVAALAARAPSRQNADADRYVRCPIPGTVVAITVAAGHKVRAGQPLAIVEAMKMENVLRAEREATVARVVAEPGDSLAVDDVIIEFE